MIALIMRKGKPPKSIVNHKHLMALTKLRNNDSISILKDDKGGTIIFMNKYDCNSKMRYHLYNNDSYRNIEHNPIHRIINEVK